MASFELIACSTSSHHLTSYSICDRGLIHVIFYVACRTTTINIVVVVLPAVVFSALVLGSYIANKASCRITHTACVSEWNVDHSYDNLHPCIEPFASLDIVGSQ
jgi:hypothetical protein